MPWGQGAFTVPVSYNKGRIKEQKRQTGKTTSTPRRLED